MLSLKPTRGPITHLLCTYLAASLIVGPALARPLAPLEAPGPRALFTQMDDPDLVKELAGEETLQDLQDMEYDRESLSVGKGVTLSLIPGGGFGLLYAGKSAQGFLMIALSAAGYVYGIAHASGSLDNKQTNACVYMIGTAQEELVRTEVCDWGNGKLHPDRYNTIDPRDPTMSKKYFETQTNYRLQKRGGDPYDGRNYGLLVIGTTYLLTTLAGAIWSGMVISEHNDEIRKRVESTAGLYPVLDMNGDRTTVGLGLRF